MSEERKNLDFTEVDLLSQEISHSTITDILNGEIYFSRYGMDRNLKQYAGIPINYKIHALFEHGVVIMDYVEGGFRVHEYLPSITSSQYRVDVLKSKKEFKGAYAIGPYIHYVESLLSKDKIKEEKEKLGNTLLVFPSHSISSSQTQFDYNTLIQDIKKISKDYDTVRICMYFQDIVFKKHLPYLKEGFQVVTAGHHNDYYFLPRLKAIIESSDMTMANDFGTQLGYCIYLGKPHFIDRIDPNYDVSKDNVVRKFVGKAIEKQQSSENFSKIMELFSQYDTNITNEQYDLVSYLWGFDEIKTPKELHDIFLKVNENYSALKYYISCIKYFKYFMSTKFGL